MTCVAPEALVAFARGELAADERAAIELHVDTCAACRIAISEACRREVTTRRSQLPEPGDVVGRYTIAEPLGEGAMGVVFAARDPELARDVAIKLLRPQPGAPEDELVRQRMLREGRALARIDHPNVVRVLDVGEWRGSLFVVMERLAGVTLRAWLETKPARGTVQSALVQCARGLAAAHAVDVVHRDFKPDNAIVDALGRARVTDFGLALTEETAPEPPLDEHEASPRLTRTHGALGTPAYMAPEQREGRRVDARADQFAWCTVAVQAVPLEAWPRRARAALRRGLADDPEQRWPTFDALLAALAPRRRWPWLALAAVVASVVAGVGLASRDHRDACEIELGWDGPAAARTALAFTASRSPGAPAAWRYVSAAIGRYEASWRPLRESACRTGSATAHCLDRRRAELAALIGRWQSASPDALATAPQAIDALAPAERCLAPESDVAVAPGLDDKLVAARADRLAGQPTAARPALAALLPAATEPGIRAEILLELAAAEHDLGDVAASRDHLIAAIAAAETAGSSRTKLLAWISLAALSGDELIELAQARDAIRLATAVLERLGNPPDLARQLDVARGIVEMRAGAPVEAVAALEHSLAPDLAPTDLARRLQILARAQLEAGQIPGALASLERAKQTLVTALGPDAGALVYVEDALVEPTDYLGHHDEAIAHGERALALLAANFGPANPRRATILGNLAVVYANAGQIDRAIALDTELVGLARDDHARGIAEINLGSTLIDAHRPSEALGHLERGRELIGRALGETHPIVANAETALTHVESELGHLDRALVHAQRALAIREQTKAGPGYLAHARYVVAQLLVANGQRAEGLALARLALTAPLATTGREAQLAAGLRAFLARESR